eukprot:4783283-Amphidinium_carterae.1
MAWPSGLRRWLKAPFKGVGSNPTAIIESLRRENKMSYLQQPSFRMLSSLSHALAIQMDKQPNMCEHR